MNMTLDLVVIGYSYVMEVGRGAPIAAVTVISVTTVLMVELMMMIRQ